MASERVVLSRDLLATAAGERWPAAEIDRAADLLAESGGQLPPRAKGLPYDLVKLIQRQRIMVAMLRAVATHGYRDTNVQHVLELSGVSRPTFYEYFANKDECFLAAFAEAGGRLRTRVETAAGEGGKEWRGRLRAGLSALLQFIADEPDAARVLIVDSRAAGPETAHRRDQLLDYFAGWIDEEARKGVGDPPSPIAVAGVVGGIETLLYSRISRGETDLQGLLPSLMYFAVLPYAGRRAAMAELRRAS